MVNGTEQHQGPPRSQAVVSFYQPDHRAPQDPTGLVSGQAPRRAALARPHHPAVGRRPDLDCRLYRPVLLPPHRRLLEGALRAAGPRRPPRTVAWIARALRHLVAGPGGCLGQGLHAARLRLLAQPLVLRDAGPAVGAAARGGRQPRDRPPLAAPGEPGLAPAPPRALPPRRRTP